MGQIMMLSGLPASGKSTFAKELVRKSGGNWVRVNKDLLRTMLHDDKFTYGNEEVTKYIQEIIVIAAIKNGQSVVVDDTNLRDTDFEKWKQLATILSTQFSHKKFNTPFDECLQRNKERGYTVPDSAIHRMAVKNKMIDGYWKDVVICDIDGTVADLSHRLKFIQGETPDYESFYDNDIVELDTPITDVIDLVRKEYESGKTIIFVSGRSDSCRIGTENWLAKHIDFPYSALLMRESKDRRPDTMVKEDFLKKVLTDYNIVTVYDDRPSVIRMWRANNLDVVDVGNGEEF